MTDLINKLQMLDFPRRESEVYLALLQKKEFTAPEISKITSVSRTKAYEVLQNLVKKGLCNENYRNGVKVFSAVNPKIVLDNYLFDYEEKKRAVGLLSKSLGEMYAQKVANTDSLDYVEVLTEVGQIKERWLNIQRTTEKELLIFTKQPYLVPLEENIEDETKLFKEKKITGRSIYEYHDLTPDGCNSLIKLIELYQKIGEDARLINELPMKMVVCDERKTIFALDDKVSLIPSFTLVIIDHPNFAIAQKKVFESYWMSSISLEEFKKMCVENKN